MRPILRLRLAGVLIIAMAAAAPTAAQAAPSGAGQPVCNQASPHFQGGGLIALDALVDSPAQRFTTDLSTLPGAGDGLLTAAAASPALTICGGDDGGISVS